MTNQPSPSIERRMAALLEDGPTTAPSGLLAATLHQTSALRQRRGWLARALGAPGAGTVATPVAAGRLLWLVAALALLAALAVAIVAGQSLWREDPLIVVTTDSPTATARPSVPAATRGPIAVPTPAVKPDPMEGMVELGFTVAPLGPFERVTWSGPGAFGDGCAERTDFCATMVRVHVGDIDAGVNLGGPEDPNVLHGRTAAELAAAWADQIGRPSTVEPLVVDGIAGRLVETPGSEDETVPPEVRAFVVASGRVFAWEAYDLFGGGGGVLRGFLPSVHFLPAGCWLTPCEADPGGWVEPRPFAKFDPAAATGDWTGNHGWASAPAPDGSVRGFWLGSCADNLCKGYVSVSVGTTATGAFVARTSLDVPMTRVVGTDLDAVVASWTNELGGTLIGPIEVDGVAGFLVAPPDAPSATSPAGSAQITTQRTALFVYRDRIIAVNSFSGFLGTESASVVLERFLPGFGFLD